MVHTAAVLAVLLASTAAATAAAETEQSLATKLVAASHAQDYDAVVKLITVGAPINGIDKEGNNALMAAASTAGDPTKTKASSTLGVLELLLDKGADIEGASRKGYTALVWAARYGRVEAAEHLIKAGVDLDFKDNDGWNALSTAVHEGHYKIVQAIVDAGADIEAVENEGYTALMWAAEEGRLDIVGLLLSAGAKVDVQNKRGGSALMWAIYEKKTKAAALLVKAGANTNLHNEQGLTALLMAAGTGDVPSVKMFLKIKGKNRPNVNAADKSGSTPLHAACQNRHADVVQLLLRGGARTNVRDARGFSPLIVAALHENVRMTALLLATGNHDIDARGKMGNTALMTAAQEGHIDVVNALLAYKTAPGLEFVDKENGFSALSSAAYFENEETVKALVHAGASCITPTAQGWNAIELAESRAPEGKKAELVIWMKEHCLGSKELMKRAAEKRQAKKDEL